MSKYEILQNILQYYRLSNNLSIVSQPIKVVVVAALVVVVVLVLVVVVFSFILLLLLFLELKIAIQFCQNQVNNS